MILALIAALWLPASVLGAFAVGHWMSGRDL